MVDYRVDGNVAILEVNNPPVNAIGKAVRKGLCDGINHAVGDTRVTCIVMCGKGRSFPAGADIKEFPDEEEELDHYPWDLIEGSAKPVVAAIHGTCLGGGLELALASHYRIGLRSARIGFPEIKLGILPGAGGTQRLPRVAGIEVTLDLIITGKQMKATDAFKHGIFDKLVDRDIVNEGIRFAKSVSGKPFDDRISSKKPIKDIKDAQRLIEEATIKAKLTYKGLLAPILNIKAVEAAAKYPFEVGKVKEAEMLSVLLSSGQAKALQYAFFAERAAPKWEIPGVASYKTVKPQEVKSVGIVGAGTMGTGITVSVLNAGVSVVLLEQNKKFLDKGVKAIADLYSGSVRLGKMSTDNMKKCLSMMKPTVNYEDFKNVDMVIEAIFENLDLKKEVFTRLDRVCKPAALLCTNTSGLNIDKIAEATKRPDQVMGTHFFAPAYYMKLLENVRGAHTSPETIATVTRFGNKIGKIPVLVGNCPGFVGNRMMDRYALEASFLLEEGAMPQQVDQVIEDFGMAMGPFKVADLSGLDIEYDSRREAAKALGVTVDSKTRFMNGQRVSVIGDQLVEAGRLGRKTGKGFYRYDRIGGKIAYPDDEVTEVILKCSRDAGIQRRHITPQEITERTLYSLINEGFKILETGMASKPEDIDTIWYYGYSWPKQTGGPMFYASEIGLRHLYDRICHYQKLHPTSPHWQPSELLKRLSAQNVPLTQWTDFIAKSRL